VRRRAPRHATAAAFFAASACWGSRGCYPSTKRALDAKQGRLEVGLNHDRLDVCEGDGSTVTARSEFMTSSSRHEHSWHSSTIKGDDLLRTGTEVMTRVSCACAARWYGSRRWQRCATAAMREAHPTPPGPQRPPSRADPSRRPSSRPRLSSLVSLSRPQWQSQSRSQSSSSSQHWPSRSILFSRSHSITWVSRSLALMGLV